MKTDPLIVSNSILEPEEDSKKKKGKKTKKGVSKSPLKIVNNVLKTVLFSLLKQKREINGKNY